MWGHLGGYLIGGGYLMRGLSNSHLFNFCRFRVDTLTGGLKVPCALTFVGKEEYYQQYPWFTDKNEAETATKLDVNVLFLPNCMFPHWNKSVINCCLGEGLSNRGLYNSHIVNFSKRGLSNRGLSSRGFGYLPDSTVFHLILDLCVLVTILKTFATKMCSGNNYWLNVFNLYSTTK